MIDTNELLPEIQLLFRQWKCRASMICDFMRMAVLAFDVLPCKTSGPNQTKHIGVRQTIELRSIRDRMKRDLDRFFDDATARH